jgi:hypothetical protein
MNCGEAREELRRAFDEGSETAESVRTHCGACPGCAAYAQRLERLAADFGGLAFGPAPAGLTARVLAGVRREQRRVAFSLSQVGAGLLAAGCLLTVLGTLVPEQWGLEALLDRAETWRPEMSVQALRTVLADAGVAARETYATYHEMGAGLIRTPLWLLALAGLALLVVYNAFEAALLRRRAGGPRRLQT